MNDVKFPSGCEACAINLDNKNMKINIFTGATIAGSKNIFTISQYPTGKHDKISFQYPEQNTVLGPNSPTIPEIIHCLFLQDLYIWM